MDTVLHVELVPHPKIVNLKLESIQQMKKPTRLDRIVIADDNFDATASKLKGAKGNVETECNVSAKLVEHLNFFSL